MLRPALKLAFYGILFGSLLLFDYLLGNGFMGMIQRNVCKIICFVKRTLRDQNKTSLVPEPSGINVLMLIMEIVALCCTMVILNRYKKYNMDCIDKPVESSNNTDKLLDKYNLHRPKMLENIMSTSGHCQINRSIDLVQSLVDEPHLIKPLNLEVPVLHMAIIDTLGTTRSQPERGDAGDIYNITDSAILSVASVLDKDFQLPESISDDMIDLDGGTTLQFSNNRYLWDVIEED